MANYSTYADVEKRYYGVSVDTFSATQQTVVTALITESHAEILGILGMTSDPTDPNDALKAIEVEITVRKLWNAEHPDQNPLTPIDGAIIQRIKSTSEDEGDDADEFCTLAKMRDW